MIEALDHHRCLPNLVVHGCHILLARQIQRNAAASASAMTLRAVHAAARTQFVRVSRR
ncbi:MAG: hypothetical protein MZW92_52820 [Comamonadaceae bacterium]|nr:hypothetical protein [Comamonadaceae bacterium]